MKYVQSIFKTAILLLAVIFAVAGTANAQSITINFSALGMTVEESFEQIEEQSGFRVTYNRNTIDTDRKIQFETASMTLEDALEYILSGTGLWYIMQNKYILIRKGEQPEKQKPVHEQNNEVQRAGETYIRTNINTLNDVNRQRKLSSSIIEIIDDIKVTTDTVRNKDASYFTSHVIPIDIYIFNNLPRFALKANFLHGLGSLTPNLGIEFGLGSRTSLEIHGGLNPWRLQSRIGDNRKLAHVFVRPEFRYWMCERFNGHFFGMHSFFAHYNVGSIDIPLLFEKEYRYDGIAVGGGLTYGYFLPFSKRWGVEFNVGIGAMWMEYDRFSCDGCEKTAIPESKTYFGPTRAGVTLVFNIK